MKFESKRTSVLLTAFRGTSSEKLINCFEDTYSKLILENDKDISVNQLISALEANRFEYVISVGQKPVIKDKVYIELEGKIGDTAYKTDFDFDRLCAVFMNSGLLTHISHNAGTSFCNNIYAHGLKYIWKQSCKARMVFVHVPFEKNISDFNDYSEKFMQAIDMFCGYK